jgi:tripartite-type tricarboxylate transporter receptor subunit TctC
MRSLARLAGLAVVGSALVVVGPLEAAYPDRPITLIVPWGAGGGTDATGRILADSQARR